MYRIVAAWDEKELGISHDRCEAELLDGNPRIAVLRRKQALMFVLFMHEPGEERIVARRMHDILKRTARPA